MHEISFDDFLKVEVRVGTIVAVDDFPEAKKPAYKLRIDFGPGIGERKSSAQLMSEALVLGFPDDGGEVTLIAPDKVVPNGGLLF
jgi:tRNA-binding protein